MNFIESIDALDKKIAFSRLGFEGDIVLFPEDIDFISIRYALSQLRPVQLPNNCN